MAAPDIRTGGHTYQHIVTEGSASAHLGDVHHHHSLAQDERVKALLLESLRFPEMRRRRDDVMEAKQETWLYRDEILDTWRYKDARKAEARSILTDWLRTDSDKLFWVSGKPGSGKSVFMKNLRTHATTISTLREWAESKALIVLEHYFWVAGAPIQSSWLGCLRTLLHDCVSALTIHDDLALLKSVFSDRWNFKSQDIPWTSAAVQIALEQICQSTSFKIVVLVDGLDECQPPEDHDVLIKELLEMCMWPAMKICASSRPWPAFAQRLEASPCIKLEELTWDEMCAYVQDHLVRAESAQRLVRDFRKGTAEAERFVWDIVYQAEGVYLWTSLVVKHISSEQRKGRRLDRLHECLKAFPQDLECYFKELIWGRIPGLRSNKADTACVLFLALRRYMPILDSEWPSFEWDCVPYYLLSQQQLEPDMDLFAIDPQWHSLLSAQDIHDHVSTYLGETCGDLLTLRHSGYLDEGYIPTSYVEFTHGTVRDFFEIDEIKAFLASYVPTHFTSASFWKKAEIQIAGYHFLAKTKIPLILTKSLHDPACWNNDTLLRLILDYVKESGNLADPAPHQKDWLCACEELAVEHLLKACMCLGNGHMFSMQSMILQDYGMYQYTNRLLQKWPHLALRTTIRDNTSSLVAVLKPKPETDYSKDDLSIIGALLSIGSDPNQIVRDTSCFHPSVSASGLFFAQWWHLDRKGATTRDMQNTVEIAMLLIRHGANTRSSICTTDHSVSSDPGSEVCRWEEFTTVVRQCVPAHHQRRLLQTAAEYSEVSKRHYTHRKQKLLAFRSIRTSLAHMVFTQNEGKIHVLPVNEMLDVLEKDTSFEQGMVKNELLRCFSDWLGNESPNHQREIYNTFPSRYFRTCVCLECAGFPTTSLRCTKMHRNHYGLLLSESGKNLWHTREFIQEWVDDWETLDRRDVLMDLLRSSNRWFEARAEDHGVAIAEPATAENPLGHPSIPVSPQSELKTATAETADKDVPMRCCLVRL